jgi:hypothetical protein
MANDTRIQWQRDKSSGPSRIIVHVKEGVISNLICILFLLSLCVFTVFWAVTHKDTLLPFAAPFFCFAWLFVCYVCLRNIRNPKSCVLAIDGDRLVWILRTAESGKSEEGSIPLQAIETLEFVLPATRYPNNARLHSMAELYIVDVDGNRVLLPTELFPGVYRKKITEAIRQEKPTVRVVERVDKDE